MRKVQFGEAPELDLAKKGMYRLRLLGVIKRFNKDGTRVFLQARFSFSDGSHPTFKQTFFGPAEEDNDAEAAERVRVFLRFLDTFGIPYDQDDSMEEFELPSRFVGAEADVYVFQGTDRDADGVTFECNRANFPAARKVVEEEEPPF